MFNRVILIVMDSVGIGALPDAYLYNDEGSNTLNNVLVNAKELRLPNLQNMGLGNITNLKNIEPVISPIACYGKMNEASAGKDTITGHWEIMGIISEKPFPTYPNGFPEHIIDSFEKKTGMKPIGNYTASGTEIIKQLGDKHIQTGNPIVYTSADSVFQVAAHESIITVEKLYNICRTAREILTGDHKVARVIARPFVGSKDNYIRTNNRKDFAVSPPRKSTLNYLKENHLQVVSIGKISDIFNNSGITENIKTKDNNSGVEETIKFINKDFSGLVFTNLIDFDMLFGHRNDPEGYANCLKEFDDKIPRIIDSLKEDDLLIITADHGCDPTNKSTDHTREYVPLLAFNKFIFKGISLGTRNTFSDISCTINEIFSLNTDLPGTSFLNIIESSISKS